MKYTTYNVQQLNRKGKPWQARAKYKDVYGKWKEVSKMLPEAKGKKEATRLAKEWFEKLNAEADLMPTASKAKTIDEIYNEYLQHQLSTGEIERSTYSNSIYSYNKYIKPYHFDQLLHLGSFKVRAAVTVVDKLHNFRVQSFGHGRRILIEDKALVFNAQTVIFVPLILL